MTTASKPATDRAAAQIQAALTDDDVKSGTVVAKKYVVKLRDREFQVADELGAMAMFEWAAASELSLDDASGLAAVFAMLEDVIHDDDWREFRYFARAARPKISGEELIQVINDASEVITGRPTEQPSGSSGTQS